MRAKHWAADDRDGNSPQRRPKVVIAMTFTSKQGLRPLRQPAAALGAPERSRSRRRHPRASLLANGGVNGCAAAVAGEYGEHLDTAVTRMRWAVGLVTGDDRTFAAA